MNKKIKVLDFWAPWCGPCLRMKNTIAELQEEYKDSEIEIIKLNIDEDSELAQKYDVRSIPNIIFLDKEDNMIAQLIGMQTKITLKNKIESLR